MTLRTDEYLAYIAAPLRRRPALPATVETYRKTLRLYAAWLGERPAAAETAQAWLEDLVRIGRKSSYVSKVAVCVQSYLQWALGDRDISLEYHRGFDLRPPHFYYSVEDVQRFMSKLRGAPLCALILQFDSGLRIGSVLSLRLRYDDPVTGRPASDLHLDETPPQVEVYVKGGKRRTFRLSARGVEAIAQWLQESKKGRATATKAERDQLFLDWDYQSVYEAYAEAARAAGLPFHGTHALRHSFATYQLRKGATMQDVSQALGHADLKTTSQIYAPLALKDLDERLKEW